jgi:RNA polymerase-interacting CarD/CdnL/TRCF family regulator
MSYQPGQAVYIAGHGVSRFMEVRAVAAGSGEASSLLVFEVEATGARVMIPVGSPLLGHVRSPIGEAQASRVLEVLSSRPEPIVNKPNYKKWNRMIAAVIQGGNAVSLASLIARLESQRSAAPIAVDEQRLLDTAKAILKSELEHALGREVELSQALGQRAQTA